MRNNLWPPQTNWIIAESRLTMGAGVKSILGHANWPQIGQELRNWLLRSMDGPGGFGSKIDELGDWLEIHL